MSIYPGSIASFTGFTSSHTLSQDNHASQHNSEQAEIIAAQTKIGTGSSTPTSGTVLRGTAAGTSAWAQVNLTSDITGVLPQANGGTGTTLATGTGKAVYDTSPTISGAILTSSPTLTTPTIADFTNSNHTHANTAGGGQLTGSTALVNSTVTADKLATGATVAATAGAENTTSTSYGDLSGGATGPAVTVTIGVNGVALVDIGCGHSNSVQDNGGFMGFNISGATTVSASDTFSVMTRTNVANFGDIMGRTFLVPNLTPGSTTFTAKYRTEANTETFSVRRISVVPL